jgi:hypothetical protein
MEESLTTTQIGTVADSGKQPYLPPAMLRVSGGDDAEMGVAIVAVAVWAIGIGLGWIWT